MNDFLWYLFEKSGNISYYLAYKRDMGENENEFRENQRNNNS